jgi:uncharacterized repeat protein (TIGR01451 family)
MKRTVFGVLVMSSLVGLGTVGVYYAQGKLAGSGTSDAVAKTPQVNKEPQPIPVPRQLPASADPYAAEPLTDAAADRYQSNDYPVAEQRPVASVSSTNPDFAEEIVDQPLESDIPDADPASSAQLAVAPASGNPFAGRQAVSSTTEGRYAEQPAAAEVVEEATARPQNEFAAQASETEPQPLEDGDPYASQTGANPLRGSASPQAVSASAAPPEVAPVAQDAYGAPKPYQAAPAELPAAQPLVGAAAESAAALPEDGMAAEPLSEGTGRPGDPALNGTQSPTLTIEKTAPPEIQIGKAAKFTIKVRNAGTATAHGVEVHDSVPQGTQLIDSSPPVGRNPEGELVWELGTLKPNDEQTIELQLMPTAEGEIGSVATVTFQAHASVRTLATKPMLSIEVLGPSKVHKGEQLTLRIKLSNPGSGVAQGIMISEAVPDGLTHAAGRELEFELGALKPGEVRELDLTLTAASAGEVVNIIRAEGDANLSAEAQTAIEVVAPDLEVAMTGPKLRYLERNATHNISITNPGTAPAKNVDLVAVLPRNLKFVEANNGGQFDEATHAVYWNLEELPPQETGTVKLTTLPLEAGEARVVIRSVSAESGLKDEREEVVQIEGLAAINFQLADLKDPIEVGGETSYEIRVTNQGTKASGNVHLAAIMPAGMKPLSAEGPVRYKIEGQRVIFEPLRQLAAKAETVFTIKVQATGVGDQRVEVQLTTDEIRDPISKQESTQVYGSE